MPEDRVPGPPAPGTQPPPKPKFVPRRATPDSTASDRLNFILVSCGFGLLIVGAFFDMLGTVAEEAWKSGLEQAAYATLGIGLLLLFVYAVKVSLFKVQASLVEFQVHLLACAVPWILLVKEYLVEEKDFKLQTAVLFLFLGMVLNLPLLGGTTWGLGRAQRAGLTRALPRLGMMFAGWGLVVGLFAVVPALFLFGCLVFTQTIPVEPETMLAIVAIALTAAPAWFLDQRLPRNPATDRRPKPDLDRTHRG
ncbi:MAG: hypothetical protein HY291_02430 [Planctomycetes bacterium]|nr:hypothetical protein [Planctomycetota bacterium]